MQGFDEAWLKDYEKKRGISLEAQKPKRESSPALFEFEQPKDKMNATERRYADRVLNPMLFAKEIYSWDFERITFHLAPRTTYTPDFFIVYPRKLRIVEIKGRLEDDASVKYKLARDLFPWFEWEMLRYDKGEFVKVRI